MKRSENEQSVNESQVTIRAVKRAKIPEKKSGIFFIGKGENRYCKSYIYAGRHNVRRAIAKKYAKAY